VVGAVSLWWTLLAIGACADRRDVLGRVSAEDARRLVTDVDRAWLASGYGSGSGGGCYGSGIGYGYGEGSYSSGIGYGEGSGSSSDGSGSNAGVYGYGGGGYGDGGGGCDGSGSGDGYGSGSSGRSSDGSGIVSLTIDGVRRTPDEVRIWLIEMATAEQRGAGTR